MSNLNYNRLRGLSCRQWSKPERIDQRGRQTHQEIGKNPKLQKQARSRERGKNSKNAILLTQWKTGRLDALYKDKLANWEGGTKTYYTEGLGTGKTNQGNHKSKTMTFTLLKIKWEDWYNSHMVNIRSSMCLFIYLPSSRWISIFFKTIPVRNEATIVQIAVSYKVCICFPSLNISGITLSCRFSQISSNQAPATAACQ